MQTRRERGQSHYERLDQDTPETMRALDLAQPCLFEMVAGSDYAGVPQARDDFDKRRHYDD